MNETYNEIKRKAVQLILEEYPKTALVYIFGSFASNKNNAASDLDLAFWTDEKVDALDVFYLQEKIARDFSMDVDLVDMKKSSEVFRFEIATTGKIAFEKSTEYTDETENKIWNNYLYLNEIRKDIVNDRYGRTIL